ncbi:MAG: hypothetical protein QOI12_2025 [Alphaproteobacteria bacterium]|jgi:hypothetical protein|nr:hypothetical protein [Alphaproteobacteria bacterium]
MTKITTSLLALLFASCLQGTPAQAQLPRTFISGTGLDSNNCGRPTPCRTLQVAYDKTNVGGEINMLDPAGYGKVIINHSISIVNDGVGSAGILVGSGQTGITIDAGPDDEINLRGLIIEGTNLGTTGIRFNTGKSLTIQKCVVRNMTSSGILFRPTGSSKLSVSDCLVTDNGDHGIVILPSGGGGSAVATLNRVEAHNNQDNGFHIDGTSTTASVDVTATNCLASGNVVNGFRVNGDGSKARLTLVDSVSAYNGFGVTANGSDSRIRIGRTKVISNASGWRATNGAVIETFENIFGVRTNFVHGNTAEEDPKTPIAMK